MYLIIQEDGSVFQSPELTDQIKESWKAGIITIIYFDVSWKTYKEMDSENWGDFEEVSELSYPSDNDDDLEE